MVIRLSKRLTGAVLFLAFSIYLLAGVRDPSSLSYLMPQLYAWLLIVLAILLTIQFVLRRKTDEKDRIVIRLKGFSKSEAAKILFYMAIILAYYIAVNYLGFVVSTVLFLVISYAFLGMRKPSVYAVSILIFAALYFLFAYALGVRFPHGWLY